MLSGVPKGDPHMGGSFQIGLPDTASTCCVVPLIAAYPAFEQAGGSNAIRSATSAHPLVRTSITALGEL